MRDLARNNWFKLLIFWLMLMPLPMFADETGVVITNAELTVSDENYVLNADIDFQLSDSVTEALRNGVPLFWNYQVKLQEHRSYLWNKSLVEKNIRYRLQYHALLNMYRVRNEDNESATNYTTLQSALDKLSKVRALPMLETAKIAGDVDYVAEMKVTFDRDALPLPLRPVAYVNPQWYLSSDSYTWELKK